MKYPESATKARILIVNNDRLVQKSLYEMLCRAGYEVDIADSTKNAFTYLNENNYHVVLADLIASDSTALLRLIKENNNPSRVIILAPYGNIEAAVESIKTGAFEYLIKPVEDKKIVSTIEKALEAGIHQERPVSVIRPAIAKDGTFHGLVGASPSMNEIYSLVERISNSKATVLLRGESGTGKRMLARAIHNADKKRRGKPFVEVSCGALPRDIVESELFGHTKGAFTGAINDRKGRFELAHGGTILLDDIDSFSPELQVKLLRVLQHKEFERVGDHKTVKVELRIIASTNQDLEKLVMERKFREDLYYRLNVISINLPPLRERKSDLSLLAEYFVKTYAHENHKKVEGFTVNALEVLKNYNWPGNIRELENIIERAVILDMDGAIDIDDFPDIMHNGFALVKKGELVQQANIPQSLKEAVEEPEKIFILQILKEVGWNKKKAAVKLGVNRATLYNKLRKYNLIP